MSQATPRPHRERATWEGTKKSRIKRGQGEREQKGPGCRLITWDVGGGGILSEEAAEKVIWRKWGRGQELHGGTAFLVEGTVSAKALRPM